MPHMHNILFDVSDEQRSSVGCEGTLSEGNNSGQFAAHISCCPFNDNRCYGLDNINGSSQMMNTWQPSDGILFNQKNMYKIKCL